MTEMMMMGEVMGSWGHGVTEFAPGSLHLWQPHSSHSCKMLQVMESFNEDCNMLQDCSFGCFPQLCCPNATKPHLALRIQLACFFLKVQNLYGFIFGSQKASAYPMLNQQMDTNGLKVFFSDTLWMLLTSSDIFRPPCIQNNFRILQCVPE